MRKQTVNRRVFFRSAAGAILALVLVGGMATSASAQAVIVAVQNGSTIVYGGATYPIVDAKVTIASRVYWVRTGGILIWCDTCTPASSGTATTGGTTGCPTTAPADRSTITVSGSNVVYGGCTYAMTGAKVTILGNTYLVVSNRYLILLSSSGGSTSGTSTCPTAPPADRSTVAVSGTNVIYGGCSYPMSGSNVTILGNLYVVGPGGLLILSSPTCPTTPPASGAVISVSGTNVVYGGCSYVMSGPVNVTILGNTYLVVSNRFLILTTPSSTSGSTPTSTSTTTSITGPTGGWMEHHAAYDQGTRTHLLVFQASYNGKDFIWGQFFNESGAKLHSNPFLISKGSGYEYLGYAPLVAASGDGRFLVSYAGIDAGFSRFVQAVEYDGGVLVGAPVKVDGNTSRHRSDVAWMPQTQRFMVTWTKYAAAPPYEQEVWAMPVTWDGVLSTARQVTRPAPTEVSPLTYPALAVGSDGNLMVVGYRDCTGTEWAGKCGIYRTRIDANGAPISATENIVYGQWSRYANVVFNPVAQVYQVVWVNHTTGGQIFGMRYSLNGTPLDSEPYVVQAPNRTNSYISDDAFSQVSLAYDPTGNDYLLAFRGQDPPGGDGTAVVLSMVATADGRADGSGLVEVDGLGTNSPSPVVVVAGGANVLVFYNYRYASVKAVPFTR